MADSFDFTVIGSGPGGYVAAIRAAQLGLKTAVIEKDPLPGGTCLHVGCIPTKALLQAAEVLDGARAASSFGVKIPDAQLDLSALNAYKDKVVRTNAKGIQYLFKKNQITAIGGRGRLTGPGRIAVTAADGATEMIESRAIVLATGSRVRALPGIAFDGETIINSDDATKMPRIPASIVVLGAGAVGVEFASIYASYGSDVTIVELLPRLLPLEDPDLGAELQRAFQQRKIGVHVGTKVESVDTVADGVRITATNAAGESLDLSAEILLVAVGRAPNTDDLGIETVTAVVEKGVVQVDANMQTAEPGLYAIGDIVPGPMLAHVASHEGIVAAEHAAGGSPEAINYDKIPSCTYSHPEVASIGLSEEAARARGQEISVGVFPFQAVGKAKILNDTLGFVKVVTDKQYDEIVGVHIIGPHATELIAEASAALSLEATAESLFRAVHAHPTLAEALGEAALAAHGRPIHF